MILVISVISVDGQISTACTNSMTNSFTPCLNFITGSSGNGASPTTGCCDSLKSLMSGSMDCACLILLWCSSTGSRSCSICSFLLHLLLASPFSPRASKAAASPPSPSPSPSPEAFSQITPAAPPVDAVAPTTNPGIRPVVTPPSASNPSYIPSPFILLVFMAILFF
ncbi:bifunctional inhibitor/lipid-transfer protein/seed storage 2S albumin superfamily protein [Actinidia rufa]|uniref:Bifunctional inhibitor/lipid-transfer protein/seed storage 2S albumin superfamily protein n=1 Tax=Actinidia rufa TaxID=165716 RepID=A0A7J0G1R6_9ERIC|nr:bifunctional inhibitor/lipid-transfer protein/seed storage 2S albumin superfamily protein [Actinidia rufa]